MRCFGLGSVVVLLALSRAAVAGEGSACCEKALSDTSGKVEKLLASWKSLAAEEEKLCPDLKAEQQTALASVAKNCPIGSRMGETLGFLSQTLAAAAADKACAEACKGASAKGEDSAKGQTASATECPGARAFATRAKLLASLNELAGHAAKAACATSACCAKDGKLASVCPLEKEKLAKEAAASRKAGDQPADVLVSAEKKGEAAAAGKSGCCEASVACLKAHGEKAAALKASWVKAGEELASMCPEKQKENHAAFAKIQETSKVAKLLPESLLALAEGVEVLEGIDKHLAEFAKANAEALKSVPAEMKASYERNVSLIHNAGEVLRQVRCATGGGKEACAKEKATAVN
jgi:hypothetical protein